MNRLESIIPTPRPSAGPLESTSDPLTVGLGDRCMILLEAVVAAVIMLLAAPVLLLIMGLVKTTSRGPMIYSQVRVGLDGRLFRIYKVRTMRHDCERTSGPKWSTGRDSRVTPVGRFLRLSHLDEIPQLWNVMRGDMGLVGPRPERPEFVSQLEKAIPRYRERLAVRPGITGLAQVQLPPDTDVDSVRRKLACDLAYIEQANIWLDGRILLATILLLMNVKASTTRRILALPARPRALESNLGSTVETSHGPRLLAS